jgi:polysaccharide deacetylase family protein (PEP-CTERM system associated)
MNSPTVQYDDRLGFTQRRPRTAGSDVDCTRVTSVDATLQPRVVNAFTIDVEDYFQVSAFDQVIDRRQWANYPSHVVANTYRLLDILLRHGVNATFFVLGWVADRHGQLVRDIAAAGHEVGCHSYWHRLVYEMSPLGFREDAAHSKSAIEDALGTSIECFRAPSFSITRSSAWAVEILAELGYKVDSSIFPVRHDRYGVPHAPREIYEIETPAGVLTEFPPSVTRIGRLSLPIGGGGYFRLYPWRLTRHALGRQIRAGRPFMFYVHPWEIDPDQPVVPIRSRTARFRHYVNLATTEHKLHQLLTTFSFAPVREVLRRYTAKRPLPTVTAAELFRTNARTTPTAPFATA